MSLSTIVLEAGGVFAHNTNQDGSGNIGVNIENTPTVSLSGSPTVSVSNQLPGPTDVVFDAGTYTANFNGATQLNTGFRGAIVTVIVSAASGTTPHLFAQPQWTPDGGTTWLNLLGGIIVSDVNLTGVWFIYPSAVSTNWAPAAQNSIVNLALPKTWRLSYTMNGTSPSFTFTAYANYLL